MDYIANGRFVAPILIYDPDTGVPFPNNMIPRIPHPSRCAETCSTCTCRRLSSSSPIIQDFTARASVPTPTDVNTYFARVDHNINDNDRVFARLAWDRSNLTRNNINPNLPVFVNSKVTQPGHAVDPHVRTRARSWKFDSASTSPTT